MKTAITKISTLKKYFFMLLALPIFFSCENKNKISETDRVRDSLDMINGHLVGVVSHKDSTIDSFIQSFNEIQANLDEIKAKEKIISAETKSGDTKNKQSKITEDIQLIYNLIDENKKKIAGMNAKLKKANFQVTELDKMLLRLHTDVEEKDAQINDLKTELENMHIELAGLQTSFEDVKLESSLKTDKMNTVYYVTGSAKDLTKQGVLTKEGGFIGIGKSAKLKDQFNKDNFTQVDASVVREIPLSSKKAKVITSHPSNSYKIEGEQGKKVNKLVITNSDEFWSTSKYLLVVTD